MGKSFPTISGVDHSNLIMHKSILNAYTNFRLVTGDVDPSVVGQEPAFGLLCIYSMEKSSSDPFRVSQRL